MKNRFLVENMYIYNYNVINKNLYYMFSAYKNHKYL